MAERNRTVAASQPIDGYAAPELNVHGTVSDLTAGGVGDVPEVGAAGSVFLDDDSSAP